MNTRCRTSTVRPRPLRAALLVALLAGGCQSPVSIDSERSLRDSVIQATRRELTDAKTRPQRRITEREDRMEDMGIKKELMPELESMAGPSAYTPGALPTDTDLLGQPIRVRKMSLERVLSTAATNNLSVQFSRLAPAVSEAQLVAAQAAFDWTFFSNLNWNNSDDPRSSTTGAASPRTLTETQFNTGLRRPLTTGGQLTVQQELDYIDDTSPNNFTRPNPAATVGLTLQVDQPLLRGAGSDVALAETRLARNSERNAVAQLRRDLIRNINDTERAYWQLVRAVRDVQILQKLLERGETTRKQMIGRIDLDATPSQIADVTARVERRRADVLRAQSTLRQTSDRLKALINDPDTPVASEVLIIPADNTVDAPLEFSFLDLIQAAVTDRPEIEQAILSIDDTAIRKVVADNARLPKLDLRLQTRFNALNEETLPAYTDAFNSKFVDYLVGLAFEQPIGNRRAEADYRRRSLERMQAVLSYRNTVQQIIGEVKNALTLVAINYKLITQTRDSRLAATDVLRTLLVEKQLTKTYSVERLDLELNRQESLAAAEREEVQALTDYNTAVSDLYASIGRTLERNRIDFKAQTAPRFDPYSPNPDAPGAGTPNPDSSAPNAEPDHDHNPDPDAQGRDPAADSPADPEHRDDPKKDETPGPLSY